MFRNRLFIKSLALFFLLEIIVSTLASTVTYALTAGPTAPEATSFEPVDTTDMVNLATGDFTYSFPLIEVPGSAGSYPMALSYHAGIQPDEDASWVGLGWNLNPGSLTRMVNGYADDFNGNSLVDRTYWEGGNRETYTVGVSVGISKVATVSAGLSFSQDTYQGFGAGAYLGADLGYRSENGNLSVGGSVKIGISPYGGGYASAGIGLGVGKTAKNGVRTSLNLGLNASTNNGVSSGVSASMDYRPLGPDGKPKPGSRKWSLMDASISSGSSKPSLSAGGGSAGISNSKEGVMSTKSDNFAIDIPIFPAVNIQLGRSYVRYWVDESESNLVYGSVGMHKMPFTDNRAYDAYSSFSGASAAASGESSDELNGGTYADYDSYQVMAQGVSGSIRPFHYKVNVGRQNLKKEDEPYTVKTYQPSSQSYDLNYKVEYHFVNDFSNRVISDPQEVYIGSGSNPIDWPYFLPQTGLNDGRTFPNVPGSKHIEYFTNAEMVNDRTSLLNRGFLDCAAKGFIRDNLSAGSQIGGFMITNPSGVTYHFSLPAYSYDEYTFTLNKDNNGGDRFNYLKNPNKYAYTWYLTAVTGADFVDRNQDGVPSSGDWGYWVSFDYGLWAKEYRWRNPGEDFNEELDKNFKSFSKGKKELYYLNRISTNTHTAIFVKEIRKDGKGVTSENEAPVVTSSTHHISWVDEGGYSPKSRGSYLLHPVSQLKLKSIYLMPNEEVPSNLESSSTNYNQSQSNIEYHQGRNVIDIFDIAANQSQITTNSQRSIDLDTDYSLCPNLPNTFSSQIDELNTTPDPAIGNGKLTLKAISVYGKGRGISMPPTQFNYSHTDKKEVTATVSTINTSNNSYNISLTSGDLSRMEVGDLITFKQEVIIPYENEGNTYYENVVNELYGYIIDKQGNQIVTKALYGQSLPEVGRVHYLKKTKNPPYKKDMQDIWSCFKSDYREFGAAYNQQKLTTEISSKNLDVWSLQSISTSTGAQIQVEYEADRYTKSVYYKNFALPLSFHTQINDPQTGDPLPQPIVTLRGNIGGIGDIKYTDYYTVGSSVDLIAVYYTATATIGGPITTTPYVLTNGIVQEVTPTSLIISTGIQHTPDHRYVKGNVYLGSSLNLGGGLRVKSITLNEPITNKSTATFYEYQNGVTSFEPVVTDDFKSNTGYANVDNFYKEMMLYGIVRLVTVAREIPAPGVTYETVNVREKFTDANGNVQVVPEYSQYKFQTFVDGMIVDTGGSSNSANISGVSQSLNYSRIETVKKSVLNFTQFVGNLKSITLFDAQGRKINETINNYLYDSNLNGALFDYQQYINSLSAFNNQGIVHEVFNHGKFVKRADNTYNLMASIAKKENYPSVQIGSTTINYKTGITTTSKNLVFDFYSGEVIKTIETDGYGGMFLTEIKPAYTVYPSMAMKEHYQFNPSGFYNEHMITQVAGSATYKVSDETSLNKLALVSASAQTWSNQVNVLGIGVNGTNATQFGVWRQRANYSFIGDENVPLRSDGLYPYSNFNEFTDWSGNTGTTNWQKQSEIKLFDTNSNALEATDVNGNFAATKMSLDQTRVFATVANAQYDEFAFTGLEEAVGLNGSLGGGVKLVGTSVSGNAHSGSYAASANANSKGFSYTFFNTSNKKLHVAVWANRADAVLKVNSTVIPTAVKQGISWYLIEGDVDITAGNNIEISCEARNGVTLFDDFRLHPFESAMVSYVYNKFGELTHILDNNNLYTKYVYDEMGRLKEVYKESFQYGITKTSEVSYHFAEQN